MSSNSPHEYTKALVNEHISLVPQISRRLMKRYGWIGRDDLESYAYIGLDLAARSFDPDRGLDFKRYACTKAMYLAVDEMRKDGLLRRADSTASKTESMDMEAEFHDPHARDAREAFEAREFVGELLKRLSDEERQLLIMVYVERMAYKEISKVLGICESAVCLRHKSLLRRLRSQSVVRQLAA